MDALERHEEAVKQKNRTRLIVFLLCLTLAVLLSALFIFFACAYEKTDFSIIRENDPACTVIDGFLYPKTETGFVYSYHLNTGDLKEYPIQTLDLSGFAPIGGVTKEDLEEPFCYFVYENTNGNAGEEQTVEKRVCASDPNFAALNRANTDTCFVYALNDGRKLLIDLDKRTAQPLFYGSGALVDEYASDVGEFSYLGGKIGAGIKNGNLLTLYRRSDEGFAISEVQEVDLSAYGDWFYFFFCNERYLQLCGRSYDQNKPSYLVCDAYTGEIRPSSLKEGKAYGELRRTPYGSGYLLEYLDEIKTPLKLTYVNVSLGKEHVFELPEPITDGIAQTISTTGAYGVFETYVRPDGALDEFYGIYVCKSGGKQADLSLCLNEGEQLESTVFLSDTILALTVSDAQGESTQKIVKICF